MTDFIRSCSTPNLIPPITMLYCQICRRIKEIHCIPASHGWCIWISSPLHYQRKSWMNLTALPATYLEVLLSLIVTLPLTSSPPGVGSTGWCLDRNIYQNIQADFTFQRPHAEMNNISLTDRQRDYHTPENVLMTVNKTRSTPPGTQSIASTRVLRTNKSAIKPILAGFCVSILPVY